MKANRLIPGDVPIIPKCPYCGNLQESEISVNEYYSHFRQSGCGCMPIELLPDGMGKAQSQSVYAILREVARHDLHLDLGGYEFKAFDVQLMNNGEVWVLTEVGLIGDEGTLNKRMYKIGRSGGIRACSGLQWYRGRRAIGIRYEPPNKRKIGS